MCKSYTAAMIMAVLLMGVGLALGASIDFESPTYSTGSVAAQDSWVVSAGTANVTANGTLSGSQELEVLGGSDSVAYRPVSTTNFTETTTFSFLFSRAVNLTGNFYLSPGSAPGARTVDVYVNFSSGINAYDGAALVNVLGEFTADHVYEVTCTLYFDNQTYDVTARDLNDGSTGSVKGINFRTTSHTLADYAPGGVVAIFADYNTLSVDDIVVEETVAETVDTVDFETAPYILGSVAGQDGWVILAGEANVRKNGISGLQEVRVDKDTVMSRTFDGSAFGNDTAFSFLVSHVQNMTAEIYLSTGNGTPGGTKTASFYLNYSDGIGAFNGGTVSYVLSEFDPYDVYKVDCVVHFTSQTYDVMVRNLTDDTSASQKGLLFRTSPHTLDEFTTAGGVVGIRPSYGTLFLDNVTVEKLFSGTVIMLR